MGDEGGEFVVEVRHGSLCEGIRGDANKGLDDGYKLCSAKIEKKITLFNYGCIYLLLTAAIKIQSSESNYTPVSLTQLMQILFQKNSSLYHIHAFLSNVRTPSVSTFVKSKMALITQQQETNNLYRNSQSSTRTTQPKKRTAIDLGSSMSPVQEIPLREEQSDWLLGVIISDGGTLTSCFHHTTRWMCEYTIGNNNCRRLSHW